MSKKQYNNAVNSIYPFVNSFTHKEIKISLKELKLIRKRLNILEQFYIEKTDKKSDIYIEKIFERLQEFIKKVFNIAIKRNEVDINIRFSNGLRDLAEIILFTSAVNLGIFLTIFNITDITLLIWGGILGLLLYFSETIFGLIKYAYINISKTNVVGEDVFRKYRYVKGNNVNEDELDMLEKVLLYSDTNSKDFKRIIDLILYYKDKIYSQDMELLKKTNCPVDVIFEIESLVDTIVSVFIVTLVSVENRDPLPGEKKFLSYILDIPKLLQHLGYIFLNTLSFNLLTSYFVHEAFYLLGINILMGFLASSFLFVVQRILRNRLRNCIKENVVY